MANLLHREVILPLNEQGDHTTSFDPRRAQFFGGAYAYSSSDPFLRNRFLTWRVVNDTLDLTEVCLDYNIRTPSFRIITGEPILPSVVFAELSANVAPAPSVAIMVVTSNNRVYRYVFAHPTALKEKIQFTDELQFKSIFDGATLQGAMDPQQPLIAKAQTSKIRQVAPVDATSLAVGLENGSVIIVNLDTVHDIFTGRRSHQEVELKEAGLVTGLVNSAVRMFKASQSTGVTSLAVRIYSGQTFVFALHDDNKIRIWSLRSKSVIKTITLQTTSWASGQPTVAKSGPKLMKLFGSPVRPGFRLTVWTIIEDKQSSFEIYDGTFAKDGQVQIELEGETFHNAARLVDFEMAGDAIWALWQEDSVDKPFTLKLAPLQPIGDQDSVSEYSRWIDAEMETPYDGYDHLLGDHFSASVDYTDLFVEYIFHPGRFSIRTLRQALYEITESYGPNMDIYNMNLFQVRARTVAAIESVVASRQHPPNFEVTAEDTARAVWNTWTKFFQKCVKTSRDENLPGGIFILPIGIVGISRANSVSIFRPTEAIEGISLETQVLSNAYTAARITQARLPRCNRELIAMLNAMNFVAAHFGPDNLDQFERVCAHGEDLIETAFAQLESMLGEGGARRDVVSQELSAQRREFLASFLKKLRAVTDPVACVKQLLAIVDDELGAAPDANVGIMDIEAALQLPSCRHLTGLVYHTSAHLILARYTVLRNLTLFLLLTGRCKAQVGVSRQQLDELSAHFLPLVSSKLKTYFILKRLSESHVVPVSEDAIAAELSTFSSLSLRSGLGAVIQQAEAPRRAATAQSVLHLYLTTIQSSFRQIILADPAMSALYHRIQPQDPIEVIGLLSLIATRLLEPEYKSHYDFSLPVVLLRQKQHEVLSQYLTLVDDKSPFMMHIAGLNHLALGEFDKALNCFRLASVVLSVPQPDVDTSRLGDFVGKSLVNKEGADLSLQYCLHLVRTLESHTFSDLIVQLALTALSYVDGATQYEGTRQEMVSYLWSNIFTHSIQNSNFDMAYLATISNPLLDRQEDCLRRILVVMAETGHLSEMMSFPFNGMVDQVASILRDKARRSDVTEQPNFYRILYSFHVTRGNYRQAAQIMYEYAERLTNGESSRTLVWLEDYVGALLSTVDALKMVDPNFAFIVIKHRKNAKPTSPKRKFGEETPALKVKDTSVQVTIKQIGDIQKQYLLAVSSMRLARKKKEVLLSVDILSAEKTLALLATFGVFEDAFAVAAAFDLDMSHLFQLVVAWCLRPDYSSTGNAGKQGNQQSSMDEKKRWAALKKYLERFDGPKSNFAYQAVAARSILHTDPRIKLPLWLVCRFRDGITTSHPTTDTTSIENDDGMDIDGQSNKGDDVVHASRKRDYSAELLKIYLSFGLLDEAADLAISMLKNAHLVLTKAANEGRLQEIQLWLPYTLIDELSLRMAEVTEGKRTESNAAYVQRVGALSAVFQETLFNYLDRMKTEVANMKKVPNLIAH